MQHGADHGTQVASRKQLTLQKKREIVDAMLVTMQDGNLPKGHMKQLSIQFRVHKSTISRVFTDIKKQMAQGNTIDVRTKKYGRTGPKPKEFSDEFLQSVPLYLRQTKRRYATALKIFHVTLHNLKKKERLRTHTCITADGDPTFVDMNHVIHIDEKWFHLNPDKRRFYLNPDGGLLHDGKYGIFPFIVKELAKKSSKIRAACTLVTKALQNVNKDVIREMLLTKVIPAI
ncbi:uncharacterized protein LOC110735817 [Chenopodium quinoa]|uniref:uncharacterized protein LOC110735817 n=1 Tax=Chenopodium quinoa TaxID=63459 RepID=UPI000B76D937|nr:uncharacterized protein LOC110735817 [Chenopodium quinoa]